MLLTTVLLPFAIQLVHSFEVHEHSCDVYELHYDTHEIECGVFHFNIDQNSTDPNSEDQNNDNSYTYKKPCACESALYSIDFNNFPVRAPPIIYV